VQIKNLLSTAYAEIFLVCVLVCIWCHF